MLWILTQDDKVVRSKAGRMFCRDSIRTSNVLLGEFEVRHIKYTNRTGKLNQRRVTRRISKSGDRIICGEDVKYYDEKLITAAHYRSLMCVNAALGVLCGMSRVPKKLKVGIYDPSAQYVEICESFLEHTDNLVVVSMQGDIYTSECKRLLWERGAVLSVSKKINSLSDCDIIVAPSGVDRAFKVNPRAVVFTNTCPFAQLMCRVFYRYEITLPQMFSPLCDVGVESDILAAGLFTHYKIYSLGGLVPHSFLAKWDHGTKKEIISLLETP